MTRQRGQLGRFVLCLGASQPPHSPGQGPELSERRKSAPAQGTACCDGGASGTQILLCFAQSVGFFMLLFLCLGDFSDSFCNSSLWFPSLFLFYSLLSSLSPGFIIRVVRCGTGSILGG